MKCLELYRKVVFSNGTSPWGWINFKMKFSLLELSKCPDLHRKAMFLSPHLHAECRLGKLGQFTQKKMLGIE